MSGKNLGGNVCSLEVFKKNLIAAVPLLKESNTLGLIEPINNESVPGYFLNDFEVGT